MIRIFVFLIQTGLVLALTALSLIAIAAFFGFAVPLFDVFNHFQPVWFAGLVVTLGLSLICFRRAGRHYVRWTGGVGLFASAIIVVPELFAAFTGLPPADADAQTLKLMSRNLFGLNYQMDKVADAIAQADPDIIALQEYFTEQRAGLHDRLIGNYPYFAECNGGRRASIAIYARRPFTVTDNSFCPNNIALDQNKIAWMVAAFTDDAGQPFTVVTSHLNWPIQISPLLDRSLDWPARIAAMTSRKATEFAELHTALSDIDGPLLVVGDFNATPWSYELRRFAERSGLTRQTHNLFTYPTRFHFDRWRTTPPFLPLDHLLSRDGAIVHSIITTDPAGSDHKALLAEFSVQGMSEQ